MGKAYDATWGRVFARFYDRALKATEENGLGAMRGELLAGASGRVIEIGAGTGVNLELYGDGVEDLTLVEPDPHMGAQLRKRLAERGEDEVGTHGGVSVDPADALAAPIKPVPAQLVAAPAEALPFPDDTFDTAVATLVLCTIPDPVAAIRELARVLKPGGHLLFIEHVRAEAASSARWQDRLEKPWRFLADGCHCNRDTEANLRASSFKVEEIDHTKMPKAAPIVRPLIRGTAVLSS
ncbi:MAG: class SAM-dependent methyltransferase [Solirubrobacterales bacterium]|nr:class SAM-dependent methyltransferase [Solirubrobacterales bacterium]